MSNFAEDSSPSHAETAWDKRIEHLAPIVDKVYRSQGTVLSPDASRVIAARWAEVERRHTPEERTRMITACVTSAARERTLKAEARAAAVAHFQAGWAATPTEVDAMTDAYVAWFNLGVESMHRMDEARGKPHTLQTHEEIQARSIDLVDSLGTEQDGFLAGLDPEGVIEQFRHSMPRLDSYPDPDDDDLPEWERVRVHLRKLERDLLSRPKGHWFNDDAIGFRETASAKLAEAMVILRRWATALDFDPLGAHHSITSPGAMPNPPAFPPDDEGDSEDFEQDTDDDEQNEEGSGDPYEDIAPRGTIHRAFLLLDEMFRDHLFDEASWLAVPQGEQRQLLGSLASRLASLIDRRVRFFLDFVPGEGSAGSPEPLSEGDLYDIVDFVIPVDLPRYKAICLDRYTKTREKMRSFVASGCGPQVAAARVLEQAEADELIWGPQLDRDDFVRRLGLQTDRLAIKHELDGNQLDLDGNHYQPNTER
jgi:hypothetical protein